MKIRWFQSLRFKLLALMVAALLATVATISFQNGRMFRANLDRQLEESVIQKSRESANSIDAILENLSSQITLSMHSAFTIEAEKMEQSLYSFISSNSEILSFSVVRESEQSAELVYETTSNVFTDQVSDPRFENIDPDKLDATLAESHLDWVKNLASKDDPSTVNLRNSSQLSGLATMDIAIPFATDEKESNVINWAVLTVWQTRIMKSLPQSKATKGYTVLESGDLLSSPIVSEILQPDSFPKSEFIQTALNGVSHYGLKIFESGEDPVIGAYNKIPRFGLITFIEQDAKGAQVMIERIMVKTGLWVLVILLVALMVTYLASNYLTRNLSAVARATGEISGGNFEHRIQKISSDELGVLSQSVNTMAQQIEDLLVVEKESARLENELETAKTVQETFFPKHDIEAAPMLLTGHYQPASECGGDWWGHFHTNNGKEFICIADATGHGAPAALVTAMSFAFFKSLPELFKSATPSPAELLDSFNKILWHAGEGYTTMTFFASIFDPLTGELEFSNAGHNFPLVVPKKSQDERVSSRRNKRHFQLTSRGTPLGMNAKATYSNKIIKLEPGDRILYYTDGLIECTNSDGEQFGKRRMFEAIQEFADQSPQDFKQNVYGRALAFFDGEPLDDDITVVIAELDATWQAKEEVDAIAS